MRGKSITGLLAHTNSSMVERRETGDVGSKPTTPLFFRDIYVLYNREEAQKGAIMVIEKNVSTYDMSIIKEIRKIEADQRWLSDWGEYLYGEDGVEQLRESNDLYLKELYDELP